MKGQISLFIQKELPQPPEWATRGLHKIITHTPDIMIWRERKPESSPLMAYHFTGDKAGQAGEMKQEEGAQK